MNIKPLFVYGILRPSFNDFPDRRFRAAVLNVDRDATTPGCIHFVTSDQGYPVAFFDSQDERHGCPEGTITGDVLWVDTNSDWYVGNRRMEEGAGYKVVETPVTLADSDKVDAQAFHYCGWSRGDRIASGNWLAAVEAQGGW